MSVIVYVRPQDGEVCSCCLARSFCIIEINDKPVISILILLVTGAEIEEVILLGLGMSRHAILLGICVDL